MEETLKRLTVGHNRGTLGISKVHALPSVDDGIQKLWRRSITSNVSTRVSIIIGVNVFNIWNNGAGYSRSRAYQINDRLHHNNFYW